MPSILRLFSNKLDLTVEEIEARKLFDSKLPDGWVFRYVDGKFFVFVKVEHSGWLRQCRVLKEDFTDDSHITLMLDGISR